MTRSRARSCASASRAGKLASARTLSLPRRLVRTVNSPCIRGYTATGSSHAGDRADGRRRDSSLHPTSGFAAKRHAQQPAHDRAAIAAYAAAGPRVRVPLRTPNTRNLGGQATRSAREERRLAQRASGVRPLDAQKRRGAGRFAAVSRSQRHRSRINCELSARPRRPTRRREPWDLPATPAAPARRRREWRSPRDRRAASPARRSRRRRG
jgi:hypothetical protein